MKRSILEIFAKEFAYGNEEYYVSGLIAVHNPVESGLIFFKLPVNFLDYCLSNFKKSFKEKIMGSDKQNLSV